MATISQAFAVAQQHHQAGRLEAAGQICRKILETDPAHADAACLMGMLSGQAGNYALAVNYISRAIALDPRKASFHVNLGDVYRASRQFREAAACYRRALELSPQLVAAHCNLGLALQAQGQAKDAIACYRRAVELNPSFADAQFNLASALEDDGQLIEAAACYQQSLQLEPTAVDVCNNLGIVLHKLGRFAEAVACLRRAIEVRPDFAEAHFNLANALLAQEQFAEGIACLRQVLQLRPNLMEAHNSLGNALEQLGQSVEAIACFQRAVELQPDCVQALNNLGGALKDQGRFAEAIACYRRAIDVAPNQAAAHCQLGDALREQGRPTESIATFRRAIELQPNLAVAYNNLGRALQSNGQLAEAVACFRQALQLTPDCAAAHNNALLVLHYQSGVTLAALAEAHREFERQHAAPLRNGWRPHENDRDPRRRLRLGFVSPDLHRHAVGFFLVRALENLDRDQCEIACYNDRPRADDDVTARFRAAASIWRNVAGQSDQALAEQIRDDRIDVLFDLAGHTGQNRLLVFARKPAPIQITWMGYVGTTGLEAMDYLLADRYEVPEGAEQYYCERVLRMPDGYVCYDPPDYAPAVSPLPALERGHVKFGCFNNSAKVTPQVLAVWAEILRRIPTARLLLKNHGFDDPSVLPFRAEVLHAHGVDPARIELAGWSHDVELLEQYARVDVALDPFPYNGGLTTCEALWMGVPVITCPGETFASRHSLSHLSNVGLLDTIARDLDDYVERTVALAGDLPRLAAMRAGLRQRMAASPLCDGRRFADNLMSLLRDAWRQWVETAGQSPTPDP